jgi:hypothetical protein
MSVALITRSQICVGFFSVVGGTGRSFAQVVPTIRFVLVCVGAIFGQKNNPRARRREGYSFLY